ncbi:hypothetical protein [Halosegnis marinus]|uniref:Putative peptidase inhibitor domain-containing protein n=1 Tax=Halosegnis marinus TaxID=3034023 RepID=A0ABD5ZSG8_9EURY|nr:hypothetical protein [Halosegnis sp. DT85]
MYLSPAVRTMRDDPTDGAEAALVVRPDDGTPIDALREAVAPHATVEGETAFGNLHARADETAVADLLAALPEGVAAVETRVVVAEETGAEE